MRTKGSKDLRARKARTSKFVGNVYSGWLVAHIGVATVQKAGAKRPGHCSYYYLLERETSDGKCTKQVRLNASYMRKLADSEFDIEKYADKNAHSKKATKKTNYSFN